jgi:MFS family permease
MAVNRRLGVDDPFALALAFFALGLAAAGASTSVPLFLVGGTTASFGTGLLGPALNAAAIRRSPSNPGPTVGLATGVMFGSMVIFPVVALPLASAIGGIANAILAAAGLAGLGGLFFFFRARSGRSVSNSARWR